jgi:hypothetical protein
MLKIPWEFPSDALFHRCATFGKNAFENAANRFAAIKYISESGKQSTFPLIVSLPDTEKPVGNQLAFISVHYRSSQQPYQPTCDNAKNVAMGQV